MSGVSEHRQSFDLPPLILRGIVALENEGRITSYIEDSSFIHDTKGDPHQHLWMLHLSLRKQPKKYLNFRSLRPVAVHVHTKNLTAYELLNEQLFIYFSKLLPGYITINKAHTGMMQLQRFIDECLDPSKRENLPKLSSLINALEKIRIENVRKAKQFKRFLERKGLVTSSNLNKFNSTARQLGIKLRAANTANCIKLDAMLQEMIIAVYENISADPESVESYIESLEKFLLLPINEAIKPVVDSIVQGNRHDEFRIEFYNVLSHSADLDPEQEYFMLAPKEQSWSLTLSFRF